MSKEKRLGRGLAALLGSVAAEPETPPAAPKPAEESKPQPLRVFQEEHGDAFIETPQVGETEGQELAAEDANQADLQGPGLIEISIDQIDENPFQPRRQFRPEELDSLSASLEQHQMLQPVLVRSKGDRYELISGERRLRAAKQAGWTSVPAQLREADDRLVAELAIVENLQRKDLNPIEKALSFRRYLDEHRCPQEELARRLGIDRSTIANLMRLLELPNNVQEAVREGLISAGHARALLPLGDESAQVKFMEQIVREGLSVRAVEQLVGDTIRAEDGNFDRQSSAKRTTNQQIASLEQQLRLALGTKVDIKQTAKGRGRVVIQFRNHDEFERLRALLVNDPVVEQRRAG